MKITSLKVESIPPINSFEIQGLGSVIIIAGANGSGKTRLKEAVIQTFASPASPQVSLTIEATRPAERQSWNSSALTVQRGIRSDVLTRYMASPTRGVSYTGTAIQIDSNRSVQNVKFTPLSLSTPDPDDLDIKYTYYLSPFVNRWQDIINKIYQKAASGLRQE